MQLNNQALLLLLGLLFHLFYLFSIFDIYFTSPIVHGMESYKLSDLKPLAKRLVLIVGDGLKADTLYKDQPKVLAPFIHKLIKTEATFGISHTRVPTESRPGHVAIIGGLYEDVSAVTEGWDLNPINFDSVFNQSSVVFSYGSEDILPMFKLGAYEPERIKCFMYPKSLQDYSKDPKLQDIWVYDHLIETLDLAKQNATLNSELHQEQMVIFLHMLGMDSAGHAFRPDSEEYSTTLQHLDQLIEKIYYTLQEFYNDNETAFIFTADHGMGSQGSHGDGHPDNTRTPIVAWGKGINLPQKSLNEESFKLGIETNLNNYRSFDMEQAAIAPLMASLIGINYPMNSVGKLPTNYLNASDEFKAKSMLINVKQIMSQFKVKDEIKQLNEIRYKPYPLFSYPNKTPDELLNEIESLINNKQYSLAIIQAETLVDQILDGLRYLQTYDWMFLRTIITAGYLGWIVFCLLFVVKRFTKFSNLVKEHKEFKMMNIITPSIILLFGFILYQQHSPWKYYGYIGFPILFWDGILRELPLILSIFKTIHQTKNTFKVLKYALFTLLILESLVYAYFDRRILTIGYLLFSLYPWIYHSKLKKENNKLFLSWTLICLINAIFPQLPAEKQESLPLILLGGGLVLISGGWVWLKVDEFTESEIEKIEMPIKAKKVMVMDEKEQTKKKFQIRKTLFLQLILILLALIQAYLSIKALQTRTQNHNLLLERISNRGSVVHFSIHWLGWIVIFLSIFILILEIPNSNHFNIKFFNVYLGLAPMYIILAISYEVLFFSAQFGLLFIWLQLEYKIFNLKLNLNSNSNKEKFSTNLLRTIQLEDSIATVLFLFLTNGSFFGTGNLASISHFSLEAVFRLIVEFNPFLMGGLLVIKILIPFIPIAACITLMNRIQCLPKFTLVLLAQSIFDVCTLNFFYNVKDEGSWLEIGTSISHFTIASLFGLFLALLYFIAFFIMRKAIIPTSWKSVKVS